MRALAFEPCCQSYSCNLSPGEVLLRGGNQSATNSAAPLLFRDNKCNNLPGWIIVFVADVRERPDHPAKFIVDLGDERAVTRIPFNRFQTPSHFGARRFVAKLAHEPSKPRRIAQPGSANPNGIHCRTVYSFASYSLKRGNSCSIIVATDSSTVCSSVRTTISGSSGASYGASIPVKSRISPARAFL